MSKQVYLPVCVDEDGFFAIDFDGAPWMFVNEQENVYDFDTYEWEDGRLDSDNADVSMEAQDAVTTAAKVMSMLRQFYEENLIDPADMGDEQRRLQGYEDGVEYPKELRGSGADHAGFLYELLIAAGMPVD